MWRTVVPRWCQVLCTPKWDLGHRVRAVPSPSTLQGPQPSPKESSYEDLWLPEDDL